MSYESIGVILENMKKNGWSADNIAFGSGGRPGCRTGFYVWVGETQARGNSGEGDIPLPSPPLCALLLNRVIYM